MAKYVTPVPETHVSPVVNPTFADNWLPQAMRQLKAIENLPDGWDSQGAARPEGRIVRQGGNVLAALLAVEKSLPKPYIHPTPSGGVQFHWESGQRYLEIELTEVDCGQFYFVDRSDASESGGGFRVGELPPILMSYLPAK
ncbi:MAG: hypothetical protein B7Z73_02295 [Planctomycetia bacterium 21-64-5]|nr:MAG: hypothetical protein B7Z73_02295 [Planctomycetia bacterium 21-64-5]HQU41442.1 hypothetical protein [Pirellulales bacterium]